MSALSLSRRSFLASASAFPALQAKGFKKVPIGLELYSVRNEMQKDLFGTVRDVAKLGYEGVEFYSPYMQWTADYAKQVRALLDEVRMKCYSTHNSASSFDPQNTAKAIELNKILGSTIIVMASAGRVEGLDGWKKVAEKLNHGAEAFKAAGIRAGYHNHKTEFLELDGTRPMELLAKETKPEVVLQLDVGTCLEAGYDPVAWIKKNPGRIRSIHCKEWSPQEGYKALFGEGKAPWKEIFAAAESKGGIEYYLIEQEGSRFPPMETAAKCLEAMKKLRA